MKKYLIAAFSCLMVIGFALGLTACGEHEHKFNWETTVEATCTQEGTRKGVCEICGEEEIETISRLPHPFGEWEVLEGPTCKKEGLRKHTCTVCNTVEQEKMDPLAHVPVTIEPEQLPQHCDETGWTALIKCDMCGDVLQEKEKIPAKEHTWGEVINIIPATCDNPGLDRQFCEVCSKENDIILPNLGHAFGNPVQSPDNPGHHTLTCTRDGCNETRTDACSYGLEELIKPATCNSKGERYRECLFCKYHEHIADIEKPDHVYEYIKEDIDETVQGHQHKHTMRCTNCGETKEENCEFGAAETIEATCTSPKYKKEVCQKCQVVHETKLEDAKGHTWGNYTNISFWSSGTCTHRKTCSECNAEEIEPCQREDTFFEATCEKDSINQYSCTLCKKTQRISNAGTKLQHILVWEHDEGTSTAEDSMHYQKCTRSNCQYKTDPVKCEFTTTITETTCETTGHFDSVCKYCQIAYSKTGAVATGHVWTYLKTSDPDNHTRVCQKCSTRQVLAHNFLSEKRAASCEQNEATIELCTDCQYQKITEIPGTASRHNWTITKITQSGHTATCSICGTQHEDIAHDFTKTNLCSVCAFDGLTYVNAGQHTTVSKNDNVKNTKEIIINPKHKELLPAQEQTGGQFYQTTEFAVTKIKDYGFSQMPNLTDLKLPYTLESIPQYAFYYCRSLQNVTLVCDEKNPAQLKRIEACAFYICGALRTFNPPDSLVYIGERAFADCVSLYEINIPDSVTDIETNAFFNTNFTDDSSHWNGNALYLGKHLVRVRPNKDSEKFNLTVNSGTLTISANAFADCAGLDELVLPDSLTHIDRDAFASCNQISKVTFNGEIYKWLSITFVNDYSSPLHNSTTAFHVTKIGKDGIVDLSSTNQEIKHTITHIPAGTFRNNTDLKEITLPSTLKFIGEEAFEGCTALTTIKFENDKCNLMYVGKDVVKDCTAFYENNANWDKTNGNEVLYLGKTDSSAAVLIEARKVTGAYTILTGTRVVVTRAFENCTGLTEVTIGEDVVYVGGFAFDGCTGLTKLTFTNSQYVWTCECPKFGISRGFTGNELNVDSLVKSAGAYNGQWVRGGLATPAA